MTYFRLAVLLSSWLALFGRVYGDNINSNNSDPKLPPIWVDNQFGNDGGFRILSEVHFPGSNASFMFEEWSLGSSQHYRLDIIHTDTGKRRTILANGRLMKKFHFEPYICSMIESLNDAMGYKFTEKFPQGHEFVIGGLGSIYLEATRRSAHNGGSQLVSFSPASSKGQHHNFRDYDQFTVKPSEGDNQFKYEIHLFFYESFLLGQTKPGSLVAIHLIDSSSDNNVVLKARIIEIETGTEAIARINRQSDDLFELPLGYGCTEAGLMELKHESQYEAPENCFAGEEPHELQIEISALLPSSLDHDVDKWKTHSSSLRLLTGHLEGRSYLVVEKHELDLGPRDTRGELIHSLKAKQSSRRTKRVWDLGTGDSDATSAGSDKSWPTYFDIDTNTGRCMNFSEGHVDKLAMIEFPLLDSSGTKDRLIAAGLTFDEKTLKMLFLDSFGYFAVRETRQDWLKFNEIVYERRDNLFELYNARGEWAWQGPISIVRKSNEFDLSYRSDQRYSANDKKVRLMILFYTKKLDQLIGKVHVDLSPCRLVEAEEFHQSISVLPCLRQTGTTTNLLLGRPRQPDPAAVGFRVQYPLEVDNYSLNHGGPLDNDPILRENIYREFLASFLRVTEHRVDLLQLNQVNIDIVGESVLVSGQLYDWPSIFRFFRFFNKRMNADDLDENRLIRELKPSEANCADSCVHLNCLMFDYCQATNNCNLLVQNQAFDDSKVTTPRSKELSFVEAEHCSLFMRRRDKQHQGISPMEFIHRFQSQMLAYSGGMDSNESASPIQLQIELKLKNATQKLVLIPNIIDTLPNEQVDELGLNRLRPTRELTRRVTDQIKAEYQVLFEGKKFVVSKRQKISEDQFPIQEANHLEYQDCESLCEENDCRSFSHCQIEKTCLISRLHKSGEILGQLESVQSCRVLVRNYLSKFHRYDQLVAKPRGFMKQLAAHSNHDCATNCMDETQFKCRSFIFCGNHPAGDGCYLRKSRGSKLDTPTADDELEENNGKNNMNNCDLYVRSYLSEFDPYYGKRLNLSSEQLITQRGLGAELCAAQCAEPRDGPSCRAFQVCLDRNQPVCAILPSEESYHVNMMSNMSIGYGQLESESSCTTFVLSTKSELYQGSRSLRIPDASPGPESVSDDSGWFIRMTFLFVGVSVGYLLAWLVNSIIIAMRG